MTEPAPGGAVFDNPFGIDWVPMLVPVLALLPLSFVGAAASLVVRYRAAADIERRQIRCIAYGAFVFFSVYGVTFATVGNWDAARGPAARAVILVAQLAYAAIPLAIGVAVLRYRLYDIDRIISRTVSYALLTALLGAVYFGAVVVVGTVVPESDVAVAASTLAVAALFGPARRRVQEAVDRRFNRERFNAAQVVDALAVRLRDQVDLETVSAELFAAVRATVAPSRLSLWLR